MLEVEGRTRVVFGYKGGERAIWSDSVEESPGTPRLGSLRNNLLALPPASNYRYLNLHASLEKFSVGVSKKYSTCMHLYIHVSTVCFMDALTITSHSFTSNTTLYSALCSLFVYISIF